MLTNEPKPATVPLVRGKWRGYFIYGPECSPELSGKQYCFSVILEDRGNGIFNGTHRNTGTVNRCATMIEGHINQERILFSMENDGEEFRAIFKGRWNTGTQQFSGTWRLAGNAEDKQVHRGDWIMEFDEALPADAGPLRKSFAVHYTPSHLREIYFGENDARVFNYSGINALVSLTFIFILLAIASGALVINGASGFSVAFFPLFILGFIMSLVLSVRRISSMRKFHQHVENSIAEACAEPDFIIHADEDSLVLDHASTSVYCPWKNITAYRVCPAYIVLERGHNTYLFPRASMNYEDFLEFGAVVRMACGTAVPIMQGEW